jgi:hypothetical protein
MNENIGNKVGVYRTTFRRAVFSMPIVIALVTVVVVVMNQWKQSSNVDTDFFERVVIFAYIASNVLVIAGLWLFTWVWRVNIFEGGIRGATDWGFRKTLAWSEINSVDRFPTALRLISPFQAILRIHHSNGPDIWIYEPLIGQQEFREQVQRLAGENHPFSRLFHES